jgi:hypothetical protein
MTMQYKPHPMSNTQQTQRPALFLRYLMTLNRKPRQRFNASLYCRFLTGNIWAVMKRNNFYRDGSVLI